MKIGEKIKAEKIKPYSLPKSFPASKEAAVNIPILPHHRDVYFRGILRLQKSKLQIRQKMMNASATPLKNGEIIHSVP